MTLAAAPPVGGASEQRLTQRLLWMGLCVEAWYNED